MQRTGAKTDKKRGVRAWSPGRRALVGLLAVFLAALALQAAERAHRERRANLSEPGFGARWIWAPGAAEAGEPIAFLAVRDFKLGEERRAWLNMTVDEAYILWVNGNRVGSGIYREGRPADLYDISAFLKTGWNRLMIEAVSSRGAGGILASLRLDEPGNAVWGSDGKWRVFRRSEPWLLAGTRSLDPVRGRRPEEMDGGAEGAEDLAGVAPMLWQLPPTGRWRPPNSLTLTRGLDRQRRPIFPKRLRHPAAPATAQYWRQLSDGESLARLDSQVVIDFGAPVTGYLEMGLRGDEEPTLLFFDVETPHSPSGRPADGLMISVPGSREWHDPLARHFRYVTIVGAAPAGWITVRPASSAEEVPDMTRGVFGLEAASPYQRVEEAVWRRLVGEPGPTE